MSSAKLTCCTVYPHIYIYVYILTHEGLNYVLLKDELFHYALFNMICLQRLLCHYYVHYFLSSLSQVRDQNHPKFRNSSISVSTASINTEMAHTCYIASIDSYCKALLFHLLASSQECRHFQAVYTQYQLLFCF